jgi:RNA polymerase sigma-54 factor
MAQKLPMLLSNISIDLRIVFLLSFWQAHIGTFFAATRLASGGRNLELSLELKNTQTLSPATLQLMTVLQMSALELSEYINEAIQENPVLEVSGQAEQTLPCCGGTWFGSYHPESVDDDSIDPLEKFYGVEDHETLYSAVCSQLGVCDSPVKRCAHALAQCLDADGYLSTDDYECVLESFGSDIASDGLRLLQSLSPAGVGARSLSECLLLQLQRLSGDVTIAEKIVSAHLTDMANSFYPLIARTLGVSLEQVYAACSCIRSLDPRPGAAYSIGTVPSFIIPDIILDKFGGIRLNDNWMPELSVSGYYLELMSQTDDGDVRSYLKEKFRRADWVMDSISQRRKVILACAEVIVRRQCDFFSSSGASCLLPMRQSDLSEELGVSVSTISRALKEKYLQCPFGLYPLNYFFNSSLHTSGDGVSSAYIKSEIRELIAGESPQKPLSDQAMADWFGTAWH